MAAYLLTQDREILAKSTPVDLARHSLMHPIICYTTENVLVPRWEGVVINALASVCESECAD